MSYYSQVARWVPATLRNQVLHPGVTLGQDLKAGDQSEVMFEALRGILPVSRLIMLVGSGSPIGPNQIMLDCSERGMMVELLRA